MNKHLLSAFAAIGLVVLGYWGELLSLPDFRTRLLAALLITYALVSIALWYVQGTLHDALRRSDPADVETLRAADPDFNDLVEDRPRIGERRDWFWTSETVALGLLATMGSLTIAPWVRTGGLTADTPIALIDIVVIIGAIATYVWWSRRQLRRYRCPNCGSASIQLAGETKRKLCASCQVVWRLVP